jgi:hypothetical protein
MTKTSLHYTTEVVISPDNVTTQVLDVSKIDFSFAELGRKKTETIVKQAHGGEEIVTRNKQGHVESTYVAQPGDAIFINIHNTQDIYVPGRPDGTRMKFNQLSAAGYEVVAQDQKMGGVRVKSAAYSKLLLEIVSMPTCIKDAWGPGSHQFLYAGATLKLNDNGAVTGIDKTAFDATWEIKKPQVPRL